MSGIQRLVTVLKESRKSEAMLALLLIVSVDLVFRIGFAAHEKTHSGLTFGVPYRSVVWWTTRDFLSQDKAPDVVLLGASDINTAFYTAEATSLKRPQSELLKHKSEFLEGKLKEFNSPYKTAFCLAVGGQMPSDSYLLAHTLLNGEKIPKVILLAVNPRNFYDATFGDPSRTAIFKTMAKLGGTREFEFSWRRSLLDSADYVARQAIALYGHKWEITSWQQRVGQSALEKILHENFANVTTTDTIRKICAQELPEDLGPNEAVMLPDDDKPHMIVDNLNLFRSYYKKIKSGMLPEQLTFYQRLCQFCSDRGVKLIVCNSPVTSENRNLIPPDIRAHYLALVASIARSHGGTFIDLDRPELFDKSDFFDTVHLNGKGGQKYFNQVAQILSRQSGLAASVDSSAD